MPDRVIIIDAHRAKEDVPFYEIKQMMGRTGRSSSKKDGMIDFVLGFSKMEDLKEKVKSNEKYIVESQIAANIDNFIFYLIPYIANDLIQNKDDINLFYKKTLDSFQGNEIDIDLVVDSLIEYDIITIEGNEFKSTSTAQASYKYYLEPIKIYSWKNNFQEIFTNSENPDTYAIAWALSNIGQTDKYLPVKGLQDIEEEYLYQTSGYENSDAAMKLGLCWWYLLGGPSIKTLKPIAKELKKQWNKIYPVLRILNKDNKWGKGFVLNNLNTRVINRIEDDLVKLCEVGFTKSSAMELFHEYYISEFDEIKPRLEELLASENQNFLDNLGRVLYERNIKDQI